VVAFEPVTVGQEMRRHKATRGLLMKKLSFAVVGAAALALAACGGQGDDALGENVQENLEAQAENLDAAADNTANAAEAAALENQADALEAQGENAEEAIDAADVNAAAVNAM
jgi:hypothetical protein